MAKALDKRWIKLGDLPDSLFCYSRVAKINEREFISVPQPYGKANAISVYNVHVNKWQKLMKHPKDIFLAQHSIAISANKLYLTDPYYPMIISDIKTAEFDITNLRDKEFKIIPNYNFNARLINVDGTIHLIGGDANSKHLIWNDDNNNFEEIYDFKQNHNIDRMVYPLVIYAKAKQKLFLVGALLNNQKYSGIWIFSSLTHKWKIIDYLTFNNWGGSAVITADEKYIIVFGRWDKDDVLKDDMIYVLDIRDDNHYKLKKSAIKFPKIGRCNILLRGGEIEHELLIIGWIKQLFKQKIFNDVQLLPMYLMKLICSWYIQEEIHWIDGGDKNNEHFVINTRHILNNLL